MGLLIRQFWVWVAGTLWAGLVGEDVGLIGPELIGRCWEGFAVRRNPLTLNCSY